MSSTQHFEYFFWGKETPSPKTAFPLLSFNFTPTLSVGISAHFPWRRGTAWGSSRESGGWLRQLTTSGWLQSWFSLCSCPPNVFSAPQMWSTLTQHFSCGRMGFACVGAWHSRWVHLEHTWVKSAPVNMFHVSEGKAGWWRRACFVCCCLGEVWPCWGTGKVPLASAMANTELVETQSWESLRRGKVLPGESIFSSSSCDHPNFCHWGLLPPAVPVSPNPP